MFEPDIRDATQEEIAVFRAQVDARIHKISNAIDSMKYADEERMALSVSVLWDELLEYREFVLSIIQRYDARLNYLKFIQLDCWLTEAVKTYEKYEKLIKKY